ncbi:MAG: hypothetical protein JW712_09635 [Dehalococcoidales bacterium]|nr:hypothetical protein [Dehalococcoidales bacterium]
MQWQMIVFLAITIPVILIPAAFIWYLNIGGIYAALVKDHHKKSLTSGRHHGDRHTISGLIAVHRNS